MKYALIWTRCKEPHEFYEVGKSSVERGIRDCLYWPGGSKKMYLIYLNKLMKAVARCSSWVKLCWTIITRIMLLLRFTICSSVLSVLYSRIHPITNCWLDIFFLFKDNAFEIQDVPRENVIYDGICRYNHINFTTKTRGANTTDNVFFAEVTHREDGKLVVS